MALFEQTIYHILDYKYIINQFLIKKKLKKFKKLFIRTYNELYRIDTTHIVPYKIKKGIHMDYIYINSIS